MPRITGYRNIAFNVTPAQYETVQAAALIEGKTIAEYSRDLLAQHVPGFADAPSMPKRGKYPRTINYNKKRPELRATSLSKQEAEEIKVLHAGGMAGTQIAKRYGVTSTTIYQIIKGKTHR